MMHDDPSDLRSTLVSFWFLVTGDNRNPVDYVFLFVNPTVAQYIIVSAWKVEQVVVIPLVHPSISCGRGNFDSDTGN